MTLKRPKPPIPADSRLWEFGLTKELVAQICEGALHGRNLSSELQPRTAEGSLKYIFGVEALRTVCLSIGTVSYENFSKNNMEGVFDPLNGRKLMFQTVDAACGIKDPQPKSKIGDGKRRLIEASRSGFLFPEWESQAREQEAREATFADSECWYVMMSIDANGTVCCEISRPKAVEDEQFCGFYERILVFKHGEFEKLGSQHGAGDTDDDKFEIKPTIQKK
ncbi:hypothetical protein [Sphingomonas sp. CFBP 8765]|uniref:hypothetical protein n=1 Tax=Sphingomonas sp. CFBP 8765 TaxID=2775274 RepID=UPI00177E5CDF|nr:hypothetical protein [Sphingomonas sp. CFBP 8765]MBD8469189.1 hypothetical protein [Sphingomonas sp. CFBP 8765]